MKLTRFAALAASLALLTAAAHAQTPVATYTFANNSFAAQEAGIPALSQIDPLGLNGFETANVFGQNRTVFSWNGNASPATQQAGLFVNTSSFLTPNSYSIELVFEFTEDTNTWRRIVDTQNRQSDNGFYVEPSDRLQVYNDVTGTDTFATNQFQHVVLTNFNNGAAQDVRMYLNGVLQGVSPTDQLNLNQANNPDRLLHFFLDNTASNAQTEFADGKVALIRLYNGVLSPEQIQGQSGDPFTPPAGGGTANAPEPGALALALPCFAMIAVARRRRK